MKVGKNMKTLMTVLLLLISMMTLNAESLFEIKDASDNTVFSISDDGLRVFNLGDTLMVISATEIKANISDGKGKALSRSFSVTTSTTGKAGLANMLEVTTESATMREGVLGERYTDFSPDNIFVGLNAGKITTGNNNVFLGNDAGLANTTGYCNVFIGQFAGSSSDAICCTYVGITAGRNSTGYNNSFFGYGSGYSNTGSNNSFFGHESGSVTGLGSNNCSFGYFTGYNCDGDNNTFIGSWAGYYNYTGSGNVFLGTKAGQNEAGSDKLYIDNSDTTTPLIYGDFATDELTINGEMNIPSLYTTTSASSRKYVFVDTAGKLCVASKDIENPHNNEEIGLLKKDNEKLKIKIEYLESEIEKIKRLLR